MRLWYFTIVSLNIEYNCTGKILCLWLYHQNNVILFICCATYFYFILVFKFWNIHLITHNWFLHILRMHTCCFNLSALLGLSLRALFNVSSRVTETVLLSSILLGLFIIYWIFVLLFTEKLYKCFDSASEIFLIHVRLHKLSSSEIKHDTFNSSDCTKIKIPSWNQKVWTQHTGLKSRKYIYIYTEIL